MTGVKKRHQNHMRKTKAQLVEELEALERELAEVKLGPGAGDTAAIALRESEKQLRAIVENSPAAILLKDTEGRYQMANPKWHEWFNPKGEDISGKTIYHFFDKDHADKVTATDRIILKTGKTHTKEYTLPLASGEELHGILHKFPVRDEDGKIIAIGGIHLDISGKKQAEDALLQSEERLHEAIQNLQQAFALYDADDRLVAFNDEYARIRPSAREILEKGGTFEDMIRANVEQEMIPEAIGREEEFIKQRIKEHRNPKGTIIRRFKDGSWSRIEEVRTPTGGIALSFIDITDLKQTEEALAKSEALFRAVVSNSPTKIHIKDVEGRYTLINKEAEKLFGITDEEGRGKTSYDLFPKEEADAFMAHDKEVIESGQSREEEEEFILEDGPHTFLTVKFPIYDQHGVSGVGAIGTDITERKQAEEVNARLGRIIEETLNEIYMFDSETLGFVEVNQGARKNLGYSMAELRGMTPLDIKPEFTRKQFLDRINPLKDDSHEQIVFETVHQRKDGSTYDVEVHLQWMHHETRSFFYAIIQDITERKKAEESSRRLNAAISALAEGISLYDAEDRLVFFNEQSRKFNESIGDILVPGLRYEELLRALIHKGLLPDAVGGEEEWIKKRLERHRNPGPPFELERQDGLWLRIHEQRLPDGGTLTLTSDITEAKRAEQALKDSEARFRDFAEVASDWFWEMDEDLRFSYFSGQNFKITGFKPEELIGKTRREVTNEDMLDEKWRRHLTDLEAHRPIDDFCYDLAAPGGKTVSISISGKPVFDADGEFQGYRGTGTDISARVMAEVALRKAKEQAEYANRAKTDFLANMSHELRTPLNSILGFSEVLMRETLGPHENAKYKEYAEDIHYSGSHLLRLISEVLDLSKLEAGEITIVEEEINVEAAIKTCIKMIEGRYAEKESPFNAKVPDDLPPMLGDEFRFKQILLNLIGNAAKFTPPDGEVTVSAEVSREGRFVIRVADTGVGIAAQDIPKVLEPFGQVHDVLTRDHEGSGLGLHLAKSFTEMHGGVLEIESALGEGTTVILTFPKERTVRQKKRA